MWVRRLGQVCCLYGCLTCSYFVSFKVMVLPATSQSTQLLTLVSSFWMVRFPAFRACCSASSSLIVRSLRFCSWFFLIFSRWELRSCSCRSSSHSRVAWRQTHFLFHVFHALTTTFLCVCVVMQLTSVTAFLALSSAERNSEISSSFSLDSRARSASSFLFRIVRLWF